MSCFSTLRLDGFCLFFKTLVKMPPCQITTIILDTVKCDVVYIRNLVNSGLFSAFLFRMLWG